MIRKRSDFVRYKTKILTLARIMNEKSGKNARMLIVQVIDAGGDNDDDNDSVNRTRLRLNRKK